MAQVSSRWLNLGSYCGRGTPTVGRKCEAGLAWTATNCPDATTIVTVPGETPFPPDDLVSRFDRRRRRGCGAHGGGRASSRGAMAARHAGNLKVALANGFRRASRWAEIQNAAEVFFPPAEIGGRTVDPFFNINRPEDLAEAEALLAVEANS